MNWPQKILIRFLDSNGNAVSGLLVFILLKSELKNDFGVEPLITNESGEVILSLSWLIQNIECAKAEFPRDYDGGIDDCNEL